jgi:nucleotide-binding universal stress UspA family protein
MVSKRLSRESGHRRKFLAVIDETPECERAVAYASRRAKTTGGTLVLLFVVESGDFQQFMGVGKIMRAEAMQRATLAVERHVQRLRDQHELEPEVVIREGTATEEIHKLIEEDQDIAILVLGAGGSKEGPGLWFRLSLAEALPFRSR